MEGTFRQPGLTFSNNVVSISAVLLGRRRATIDEALTTVQQISERQIQKLLHESPSPSPHMWGPMSLLRYFKQLLGFESDAKRDVCTKTNSSAKGVMDGFDGSAKFESNFGMCRTWVVNLHWLEGLLTNARLVLTSHGDSIHRNTPYMLRSYEILSPDDRGLKNADQPTHNFTLLDVCCALLASRNRPCEVDTPGIQGPFCDASFEGYSVQDEVKQEITALHSGITEQLEYKLWNEDKKPTGTRSWFSASEPKTAAQESLGDIYLDQSRLKLPGLIQEPKCDPSGMSQRIEATIKKYCATDDVRRILRGWAQKMVASRKHRAGFQRWETFAFGVCYRCCICEDEGRNSGFMDVDTWGSHMANKHETPPFTVEGKCRVMP